MRRGMSRRADDTGGISTDEARNPHDASLSPSAESPYGRSPAEAPEPDVTLGDPASGMSTGHRRRRGRVSLGLVLTALATVALTLGGLAIAWRMRGTPMPTPMLVAFVAGFVLVQMSLVGLVATREWLWRRRHGRIAGRLDAFRESLEQARTILEAEPQIAITWNRRTPARRGRQLRTAGEAGRTPSRGRLRHVGRPERRRTPGARGDASAVRPGKASG